MQSRRKWRPEYLCRPALHHFCLAAATVHVVSGLWEGTIVHSRCRFPRGNSYQQNSAEVPWCFYHVPLLKVLYENRSKNRQCKRAFKHLYGVPPKQPLRSRVCVFLSLNLANILTSLLLFCFVGTV